MCEISYDLNTSMLKSVARLDAGNRTYEGYLRCSLYYRWRIKSCVEFRFLSSCFLKLVLVPSNSSRNEAFRN